MSHLFFMYISLVSQSRPWRRSRPVFRVGDMSGIDEAEARLLEEVLGSDWDLTLPESSPLDFLQQQDTIGLEPFPQDYSATAGLENLEGFGAESGLSWLLLESPTAPTNEGTPNSNHDQDWKLDKDPPFDWNGSAINADPKSPSSTRTSNSSCQTSVDKKVNKTKKKPVAATSCTNQGSPCDDAERKRKARQERNRENAHNSRQRKKMYLDQLEIKCRTLESENYHLKLENASLKYQIGSLYQTFPVPGDQQVPGLAPYGSPTNLPFCPPVFDYGKMGVSPKLPLWPETTEEDVERESDSPVPLLEESCTQFGNTNLNSYLNSTGVLQDSASGESKTQTKINGTGQSAKQNRGGAKRNGAHLKNKPLDMDISSDGMDASMPMGKKQKLTSILACVGLLCMCALAMNFGKDNGVISNDIYREPGRHLQALPGPVRDTEITWDLQIPSSEVSQPEMNGCPRKDAYTRNLSPKYDVHFPSNGALESSALDKLKELGPLAVLLSEADVQIGNRRLLPDTKGWTNFTELVNGVFSSSGFLIPGICKEEFRFDASLVKDVDAARKKLQRQLSALAMYKRHSLDAIPLPPAGNWKEDDGGFTFGDKDMGYEDAKDKGFIVSLFLPIQDHMERTGILTAINSIYVVLLKPTATYVTYSCPLTVPVYA